MNNDEIKEMYEREGGPALHPDRSTDEGLTAGDAILITLAFLMVVAICVKG